MTTTETKGQRIISLSIRSYMGVEVGEVRPKRNGVTYVGGLNGTGKTSFLSGIEAALGDKRFLAQKPIREGAEKGEIDIELPDYTIRWEVKGERTTKLTVFSKAIGEELKKPATVLGKLFGPRAFNPLGFSRMDDAKQREAMISLAPGLQDYLAELVVRRAAIYEERTGVNRTTKRLEGALKQAEQDARFAQFEEIPDKSVSAESISVRIKEAEEHNAERAKRVGAIERARGTMSDTESQIAEKTRRIAELQAEIEVLAKTRKGAQSAICELTEVLEAPVDTSEMIAEYDTISSTNEDVAFKRDYYETKAEMVGSKKHSDDLTARIDEVDSQRHKAIKTANFPVEGVDFSDDGVLFNGLPFDQASMTEQILTSFAIEAARNPLAKFMIIYEASLMDDEHLDLLHNLAIEADVQVLAEYVTRSEADEDRCSIVFVDGVGTAREM